MEQVGEDYEDIQVPVRRRRRISCSHETAVNVHNHFSLKFCEVFLQSWFLFAFALTAAGLTCMIITAHSLMQDICDYLIWILYTISAIALIFGVTLMGNSLAKCLRFAINECPHTIQLENITSESFTGDAPASSTFDAPASSTFDAPASSTFDAPASSSFDAPPSSSYDPLQSVPFSPELPRKYTGPIKVRAVVHRSQDSSGSSLANDSLCNLVLHENSANNNGFSISSGNDGEHETTTTIVQEVSDENNSLSDQKENYSQSNQQTSTSSGINSNDCLRSSHVGEDVDAPGSAHQQN